MIRKKMLGFLRVFAIFAPIFMLGPAIAAAAQLEVEDPPSPGENTPTPLPVTSTMFTFSSLGDFPPCFVNGTEVASCWFLNQSGQDWTTLELRISPGTEFVGCFAFPFDECDRKQGTEDLPTILTFSGGSGIPQGKILALSGSGWLSAPTFVVTANIPEPVSAALMLSGIGVLLLLRRKST